MKKLVGINSGNFNEIAFWKDIRRIHRKELSELIMEECRPSHTGDKVGVLVYMSKVEFEKYQSEHE